MTVDPDQLCELLKQWQGILRLRDWDIKVHLMEKDWRKSGDIKVDAEDKKAVLLINRSPRSANLEELVVHELVHLKLWYLDQMIEDLINLVYGREETDPKREFAWAQFMTVLETTVEDLTKGYLAARGCRSELSFGRLSPQIEREMSSKEHA